MHIRESAPVDLEGIIGLHQNAFGVDEGESVAELVRCLLSDESSEPILSLVAERSDELMGHVLFTSVRVNDFPDLQISILCPLAVNPVCQREGVGASLIRKGLDSLKSRNTDAVLVLGDPKYYSRSGFKAGHGIRPPYDIPYLEAWMAIELIPGVLKNVSGVAICADSLQDPKHW